MASGHAYRNSTGRPTRLITVLGVWLIFGPQLFVTLLLLIRIPSTGIGSFVGIAIPSGIGLISGLVIFKSTRGYLRGRRDIPLDIDSKQTPPNKSDNAGNPCPDCGELIEPGFDSCWNCSETIETEKQPDTASPPQELTPKQIERQQNHRLRLWMWLISWLAIPVGLVIASQIGEASPNAYVVSTAILLFLTFIAIYTPLAFLWSLLKSQ